jgi:hypothetical protein
MTFDASPYLINELKEEYKRMYDAKYINVAYNCMVQNILWALNNDIGDESVFDYIKNDTDIDNDEFAFYVARAEADGFIYKAIHAGGNSLAPLTLLELNKMIQFRNFPKYDYLLYEVLREMDKAVIESAAEADKAQCARPTLRTAPSARSDDNVDAMRYLVKFAGEVSESKPRNAAPKTVSFQDIELWGWNIFNERFPNPVAPTPPRVLKMKVADMDINRWDQARDDIKQYQDTLRIHRLKSRDIARQRDKAFFELLMKRYNTYRFFDDPENKYRCNPSSKRIIQQMYNRAVVVAKHNRKKSATNYAVIATKFEEFMRIGLV